MVHVLGWCVVYMFWVDAWFVLFVLCHFQCCTLHSKTHTARCTQKLTLHSFAGMQGRTDAMYMDVVHERCGLYNGLVWLYAVCTRYVLAPSTRHVHTCTRCTGLHLSACMCCFASQCCEFTFVCNKARLSDRHIVHTLPQMTWLPFIEWIARRL